MKAVWKGYLKCSLVTIPIKRFNAVAQNSLQLHLYHRECGSQIRQEMICPVHQRSLNRDEVVRGYQELPPRGHFRAPAFERLLGEEAL